MYFAGAVKHVQKNGPTLAGLWICCTIKRKKGRVVRIVEVPRHPSTTQGFHSQVRPQGHRIIISLGL